jgi:hypothetical protein
MNKTSPSNEVRETLAPDGPHPVEASGRTIAAHSLSVRQRILVMALNALPLLHAVVVLGVGFWSWAGAHWRVLGALLVLYLLPALAARVIVKGFPIRATRMEMGSPDFFKWWALHNMQALFCRLPLLEEVLRLVPSLYSAWLRLWGSRIGRLVYWAPGTRVIDRSFLEVGDDVLFGAGVELIPHLMTRNERGETELLLAPIRIGARAVVGGYSLLAAGTEIPPDEATRAHLLSPPFTKWERGKRVRE